MSPSTPDQIAARRRDVARLLLARTAQQEMARQLGCSQATISGDVQAIRAAWGEEDRAELAELVGQECRALDADEACLRARFLETLPEDIDRALRIYDRLAGIAARRLRWRQVAPPIRPAGAGEAADQRQILIDAALISLGLGPQE